LPGVDKRGYGGREMNKLQEREKLPVAVKFTLFVSSYFPLFSIIILKQIEQNMNFLTFGGINISAIQLMFAKFGISVLLAIASAIGLMGLHCFIENMKKITEDNGDDFVISRIENKNTESIGYVATYLLPFVFQEYSSLFEILELFILLTVMYVIYTHSTLIVVNPVLSLYYSLYNIEYYNIKSPETKREGIFIVNCHYLEKGDTLSAKKLNANLFYGIIKEE
jgi:hypothetical protein